MLPFKVHQFCLRGTYFLLLPKLNARQMQIVGNRLGKLGGLAQSAGLLSSRLREGVIHVDPAGLCWSRIDPADAILPLMPDIISSSKEKVSLGALRTMYYHVSRTGRGVSIHLSLRLESGSLWKALRASGDCALAPDEHAVARSLLGSAAGSCEMVTDYPAAESAALRFGRRRYFASTISSREASSTLRMAGTKASRNSYILKDGTLGLNGVSLLSDELGAPSFDDLGEWCFYTRQRESSNCSLRWPRPAPVV